MLNKQSWTTSKG